MKFKLFFVLYLMSFCVFSQELTFTPKDITINEFIDGTLLIPNDVEKPNLAIIIAGSGPTDRNGNQNMLKNNSLKKLAEELSKEGLATFRYDKRIVKQIRKNNVDMNIRFDDFITDAISVLNYFKNNDAFNKVYIIGHSQGSLVGIVAAKEGADGFISLAGAGKPIDEVIIDQVTATAPMFAEDTKRVFSIMKEGKTTTDFPQALISIFNLEVQPFMMSWMAYNPQEEIRGLEIPVLIINGTKDLQVSEDEANLLHSANTNSTLKIIEKMNHILVPIEGDTLENSKSYNESQRKISGELIQSIVVFTNNNK
ncbi:MAG: alpha/beta hydrolase [Flavobacteriaceae bacterium]|nr:alpha/beta hydrolase [Flavobacteriaceae bacterium]